MDISQKGEESATAAEGGAGDTRLSKTLPLASKTGAGSGGAFKHFPLPPEQQGRYSFVNLEAREREHEVVVEKR